eukprot:g10983.t1
MLIMNKKAGAAAGKRREKQTGRRRSQSERLLPNDVADIKVADEVGDSLAEQAFRENDDKMDEEEDSLDRFARAWGLTREDGAAAAAKLHQAKEPKKASRLACISLRTSNKMKTSKSLPSSTMKKNAKKNKPATKMKQAPRDVGASSGLLVGVRKGNKDKKMKNASAASGRGTNQAQTTTSKTTGSRMKMKSKR